MMLRSASSKACAAKAGFAGISSTKSRDCTYAPAVTEEIAKSNLRRTLLVACLGTILGFAGASARGPELVSLLFKPLQDSFSCSGSVNLALTQFVRLQLTCAVLGAVVALAVLMLWRRFLRKRAEARQGGSAS